MVHKAEGTGKMVPCGQKEVDIGTVARQFEFTEAPQLQKALRVHEYCMH